MDAALLLASLSLTTYLAPVCCLSPPPPHPNSVVVSSDGRRRNLVSIQIVVCLSFLLFSLSVVECTPSSWLLLFTNENSNNDNNTNNNSDGRVSIATAYYVVLSALCTCLLVVFPAMIGVHLVPQKLMTDKPDEKSDILSAGSGILRLQSTRWFKALRVFARAGTIILQVIFWLSLLFWRLLGLCRRRRQRDGTTLLPLTSTQQQSQLIQQKKRFRYLSGRMIGATFLVLSLWTALWSLTPLVMQIDKASFLLAHAVSWLCAVGFLLAAVLNGFGSVSFPFTTLTPLYLKQVSPESVMAAAAELERLEATRSERQWQLHEAGAVALLLGTASTTSAATAKSMSSSGGGGGIVTSRTYSGRAAGAGKTYSFSELGEEVTHRRALVANEIAFLDSLIEEARNDLEEMRYAQQLAVQARTPLGRIRSSLGMVMSVVLLLRLLTAVISLNAWSLPSPSSSSSLRHNQDRPGVVDSESSSLQDGPSVELAQVQAPRTDIVTLLLLWMTGHTNLVTTPQQLNNVSQFISLMLTAFLSVSQVRFFLQTASAVNRRLASLYSKCYCYDSNSNKNNYNNQKTAASPSSSLLLSTVYSYMLASLAGCYFLACVVLTKMMLPEAYSSSLAEALGGGYGSTPVVPVTQVFWIRSYAVNATFCLSALVSAAVLGMLFGIQRQNTHRYSSWVNNNSTGATATAATKTTAPTAAAASSTCTNTTTIPTATSSSLSPINTSTNTSPTKNNNSKATIAGAGSSSPDRSFLLETISLSNNHEERIGI